MDAAAALNSKSQFPIPKQLSEAPNPKFQTLRAKFIEALLPVSRQLWSAARPRAAFGRRMIILELPDSEIVRYVNRVGFKRIH
jgi:hypothetical protein